MMLQPAVVTEEQQQPLERLVRPEEVRRLLGIGERRFYQFAKDGTLPVVRVGGSLRVRVASYPGVSPWPSPDLLHDVPSKP
jgi:predicted DNA-binding transcriptional regulator AlpA